MSLATLLSAEEKARPGTEGEADQMVEQVLAMGEDDDDAATSMAVDVGGAEGGEASLAGSVAGGEGPGGGEPGESSG